jgi:thiosulfate reductase/polysulfide reductase chain A
MASSAPAASVASASRNDPDRLVKPLLRVGPRGSEEFKAVSWDEALSFIATKLDAIRKQARPRVRRDVQPRRGRERGSSTSSRPTGRPTFGAPSFAQCRGPRDVGNLLTWGTGLGSPEPTDIANTKCLVLIGTHLGENMHNTQVQEFAQAIANRATIICVDPRHSTAASKAKHWLPIRPGTDLALVLAWMNVLVKEGLYDREFVAKHGHGFDKFAASIAENTPEWAEKETGIAAAVIRETAREMAPLPPGHARAPGTPRELERRRRPARPRDRAAERAARKLGAPGRPVPVGRHEGRGLSLPEVPGGHEAQGRQPRPSLALRARAAHARGSAAPRSTGKPYPIKGWFVYAANLIQALPSEKRRSKAIKKLDLLVVVETHPSEIAGYADVVLPEASYLERHDDLRGLSWRQERVALRQPVIPPPGDQSPPGGSRASSANRLGLGAFFPWRTWRSTSPRAAASPASTSSSSSATASSSRRRSRR